MTKLRLFVLLAVVALVLFPAMASAQGAPLPCRFHGTVQLFGEDVAGNTTITATIGNDTYTTQTPAAYGASTYLLEIAPEEGTQYAAGETITFMIGASAAEQTSAWETGGNIELNLSIGEAPVDGGAITSVVIVTLAAGASATADYDASTGVLTLGIPAGQPGAAGAAGAAGAQGDPGANAAGGTALPVVALIIAIIAVGMAIMVMRRRV